MHSLQGSAPLYEALRRHAARRPFAFHVPGHMQGRGLPEELLSLAAGELFNLDVTEIPGLDDLHNPQGPIALAQELAAHLYGAYKSFFLVNGTTTGLQALLTAVVGQGKVIVPRNAHRSVLAGLVISGADPVYVAPEIIPDFNVDCGVKLSTIKRALEEHPDTEAVLALHPNFYGITGDLGGLVRVVHQGDKPLLVDEAHGAHLRFHPELPQDAISAGADASVQSTHKLGGSLTQTSLLHLRDGLVEAGGVAAALCLLQTTSPSYILMASLDLARRQLATRGKELLEKTLLHARWVRRQLSQVNGIRLLSNEHLPDGSCGMDATKLVISVKGLGMSGYQVGQLLADRYGIFVEMSDITNIVAFLSIGTKPEDCRALVFALQDIATRERGMPGVFLPEAPLDYKKILRPRAAWFSPSRGIPLGEAAGRISAESVAVYPPGIPAVNPGEEITKEIIAYLAAVSKMGLHCQGPSDPALKTIQVVIE